MTLTRTYLGDHPDTGAPYYNYTSDGPVVLTGPATGDVTLADGATYAVDAPVVEAESVAHAEEIAHHIALQHEETGALNVAADQSPTGEPVVFVHDPSECAHCINSEEK